METKKIMRKKKRRNKQNRDDAEKRKRGGEGMKNKTGFVIWMTQKPKKKHTNKNKTK